MAAKEDDCYRELFPGPICVYFPYLPIVDARSSVVIDEQCYKPEGRGFMTRRIIEFCQFT
jgi:hypothetical protein